MTFIEVLEEAIERSNLLKVAHQIMIQLVTKKIFFNDVLKFLQLAKVGSEGLFVKSKLEVSLIWTCRLLWAN